MSLARRSLQSAGYNIFASGFQAIIQFVRSILLARILLPEHFGVYAYAFALVKLTATIPNFGMTAALVHRSSKSEGEVARRVHFSLAVIFTFIWAIVLLLISPWFIETENRWVFWVILAAQVVDNLTRTPRIKLMRRVKFQRIAIMGSIDVLVGSGIAVLLAYLGTGIWSLVSTDISTAVISILGYYVIQPVWRPRFGWSRDVVVYLLDFGRRSFLATALLQALDRVDDLWTGIFLGKTALGFYSRAFTFATYPRKLIAAPINQVASGTYAALKEQPKQLSQAFFRVNAFLIRTGFLIAGLLFLSMPEFIHFIIGDKWLPMLTTFQLMLVYTLLDPIKTTIGNVFNAVGKPEKVVQTRIYQLIVMLVGLFILGPRLGINGVAIAVDIMLVFGIVLFFWQVRKYVQFSIRTMFVTPLIAFIVGMGFSISLSLWINPLFLSLGSVLQKSLVFLLGYGCIMFLLEKDSSKYLIRMVRTMFQVEVEK